MKTEEQKRMKEEIRRTREEQEEKIKRLAINYGINLEGTRTWNNKMSKEEFHLGRMIMLYYSVKWMETKEDEIFLDQPDGKEIFYSHGNSSLQLAKYILMLSKALINKTGIEVSTIVKGIPEKPIFINGRYNLHFLYLFTNTLLEKQSGRTYINIFKWEPKEVIYEDGFENFTEPYTEEELEEIIKFEKEKEKESRKKNIVLKKQIEHIVYLFRRDGVFKNTKIEKGIIKPRKELSSKEYQFLYDTLAVLGVFTEEEKEKCSASDKKEALRDYLRVRDKKM